MKNKNNTPSLLTDKWFIRGIGIGFFGGIILMMLFGCKEEFIVPYNCIDESKIVPYKDRVCTMEVEYVCGCNGQMYINRCHAEADGLTTITPATIKTKCK